MLTLHAYWRSTTSYRVRAALELKGIAYRTRPVDLVAGAQHSPDYLDINPSAGVPALVLGDGTVLTQSLAILDWLEETHPAPPLLPENPLMRARVRAAAQVIALDVHPVNNLRVVSRLRSEHGLDADAALAWMRHWMAEGFRVYDALLPAHDGAFSFGDAPDLADLCLVAQLYNAHRWGVDLAAFPRLVRIEAAALRLPAFEAARPEAQPDAIC
ncbi:maleylacetoacetate isomerase [Jannaschia sp. W003]|uniref:maleylacetoacetate isomerase n=1 Tax=Jannaschia sp. W003 TaxID=2867012 RepID=UPI0021A6AF1C|nr:maleylacetoacetate isomerase [Jannaschia sp. W003]UWQ20131.1 maleylacetoacetate isomerase [Jannaschia sp. W003]